MFFCKYNDPPYVKLQKLEIMVRIANEKNFDQLLSELKEYALEVDMDFVKRAVKAIGQVAIKIEAASEKCVNALLDLIATKVNYVVQEVIVVIKDILRKYPGYEGVIPTLCKYIDELDEPNARGSLIWIVGEYAEKINNADDILSGFVDVFSEEFTQVSRSSHMRMGMGLSNVHQTQLQILTAVVKLFLKKPSNNQGLVQKVLQLATADSDNPDIRDRAYIYWRLLSGDLDVAKVRPSPPACYSLLTPPNSWLRTSSSLKNLPSPQRSAVCRLPFSRPSSRNSRPSPLSTTSHPSRLSARVASAPRPSSALPSKNSARTRPRTQLPHRSPQPLQPTARLAALRRATLRTYSTLTLMGRRLRALSRTLPARARLIGSPARKVEPRRAAAWRISWACLMRLVRLRLPRRRWVARAEWRI